MTKEVGFVDAPFFQQWYERGTLPRSLDSSKALANLLSLSTPPSIGVVGSKGKGTTVAATTRALVDAGMDVVSISSPSLVTSRERIRHNGRQVSTSAFTELAATLDSLLPQLPTTSYLSPSGAFTMMGAWYAGQAGADIVVIEEGVGGVSDEVSLFDHVGLGVTPIFFEHGGILGTTTQEIATNLLGAGPAPVVVSALQSDEIAAVVQDTVTSWGADLIIAEPDFSLHHHRLTAANMTTGFTLGATVASRLGYTPVSPGPVNLPGRCSLHEGPTGTWLVDGAITPEGVEAALEASPLSSPTILGCWPLDKPFQECAEVSGATLVRSGNHLSFPDGLPRLADLEISGDVIALGTQSFIGEVLRYLDVDTGAWF